MCRDHLSCCQSIWSQSVAVRNSEWLEIFVEFQAEMNTTVIVQSFRWIHRMLNWYVGKVRMSSARHQMHNWFQILLSTALSNYRCGAAEWEQGQMEIRIRAKDSISKGIRINTLQFEFVTLTIHHWLWPGSIQTISR